MRLTLLFLAVLALTPALASTPGEAWLVAIDGPIGPATADHVVRNLQEAQDNNAEVFILRMDTPGGLDTSMREIIQAILASRTPVVGYVAPQGSRAASAGTYILYASHIAAMAPATNLGAATPVQIGGGSSPLPGPEEPKKGEEPEEEKQGSDKDSAPKQESGDAMQHKIVNDAKAYILSLAELRGRNAEWAVKAVTEAATLTATQALEENVIDLIAEDETELLKALHGRTVTVADHKEKVLNTAEATLHIIEPDWRTDFLNVITNPSVAYILLIIGIYGLIFEFSNPGIGVGGITGAICLLIAFYALQLLPISYSALALMLLGLGLMAAEAFTPSFGILGLGGIAAFIIGSIMLMDTDIPGFRIALPIILALAAASAAILILVLSLIVRSRRRPLASGLSTLVGKVGEVTEIRMGAATIRLQGELWRVKCETPLSLGDRVRVTDASSLVLDVIKEE